MNKLTLAVASALATAVVSTPAVAAETLTATFLQPDGGVTTDLYSGLVSVTVSGTGQSDGPFFNDAFYLLQSDPGADTNYYQLTFGLTTLVAGNPAQNAVNFIVGGRPVFRADNTYSFVLNTGTNTPTRLHFGVGDGQFQDNSGAFRITVAAIPEPATWGLMLAGFGLVGAGLRSRRRSTTVTYA